MKKNVGILPWIFKQIVRRKWMSLIIIILPIVSILSIAQVTDTINKNKQIIKTLYENTEINCSLACSDRNFTEDTLGDLISPIFEEIKNDEQLQDVSGEAVMRCNITVDQNEWNNNWIGGIMSVDQFKKVHQFEKFSIDWCDGFSDSFFDALYASNEVYEEKPEAVISQTLAEIGGLSLGDYIDALTFDDGFTYKNVKVVGISTSVYSGEMIFVPNDVFVKQRESGTVNTFFYKDITFSITPEFRENYEDVVETINQRLNKKDATIVKRMQVVVDDEELKIAIKPTTKVVQTLEKLRPILICIFFVCEISILYFMLLLRKGEIRTMKYLGTNTMRICKCYIGEYLFECVLGTSIGAGIVSVSQLIEKSLMWYQFKMGIVFDIIAILVPGIVAIQIYQKGDRS